MIPFTTPLADCCSMCGSRLFVHIGDIEIGRVQRCINCGMEFGFFYSHEMYQNVMHDNYVIQRMNVLMPRQNVYGDYSGNGKTIEDCKTLAFVRKQVFKKKFNMFMEGLR